MAEHQAHADFRSPASPASAIRRARKQIALGFAAADSRPAGLVRLDDGRFAHLARLPFYDPERRRLARCRFEDNPVPLSSRRETPRSPANAKSAMLSAIAA